MDRSYIDLFLAILGTILVYFFYVTETGKKQAREYGLLWELVIICSSLIIVNIL